MILVSNNVACNTMVNPESLKRIFSLMDSKIGAALVAKDKIKSLGLNYIIKDNKSSKQDSRSEVS